MDTQASTTKRQVVAYTHGCQKQKKITEKMLNENET